MLKRPAFSFLVALVLSVSVYFTKATIQGTYLWFFPVGILLALVFAWIALFGVFLQYKRDGKAGIPEIITGAGSFLLILVLSFIMAMIMLLSYRQG